MLLSDKFVSHACIPAPSVNTLRSSLSKSPTRKISVYNLEPGDHVCYLFHDIAKQLQTAVSFLVEGLKKGERCVYIARDHSPELIKQMLSAGGIRAEEHCDKGNLSILMTSNTYLQNGIFLPKNMMVKLRQLASEANPEGAPPVRIAGEMNWVFDTPVHPSEVVDYELRADCFFLTHHPRMIGLCQYDARRIPAAMSLGMHLSHRLFIQD